MVCSIKCNTSLLDRFVCEFVRRLEVGEALKSPEEAARWVSILPSSLSSQVPADLKKPWFTLNTAVMVGSLVRTLFRSKS